MNAAKKTHPKKSSMNVGQLLAVFGVLLIAVIWIAVYVKVNDEFRAEQENVMSNNANVARLFEEHVLRSLSSVDQLLLLLKWECEKNGNSERIQGGLVINELTNLLSIADEKGNLIYASQRMERLVNVADREYFQVHAQQADLGLTISKPLYSRIANKWVIQLVRRIDKPDGSFGGLVIASVDPLYFANFYREAGLGRNAVVALIGNDGVIRARQSEEVMDMGQDIAKTPLFAKIKEAKQGSFIAPSVVDGLERIYSVRAVSGYPLTITVGTEKEESLKAVSEREKNYYLGATVASILIIGFITGAVMMATRQRRQAQFLNFLHQISLGLLNNVTMGELLALINRYSVEAIGAQNGFVAMLENDQSMTLKAGCGVYQRLAGRRLHREDYDGVLQRVASQGTVITVDDAPLWSEQARRLSSNVLISLRSEGEAIGLLLLSFPGEELAFSAAQIEETEKFAALASVAINNARLYARVESELHERKQIEDVLREKEQYLDTLFDSMSAGILVINQRNSRIMDVNAEGCRIIGAEREQVLGQRSSLFIENIAGADKGNNVSESELKTVSGTQIPILQTAIPVVINENQCLLINFLDISDKKRLEKELARFDRLNLVGEMAASIGHEVRNPMTTVRGYLQWLSGKKDYQSLVKYFDLMIEELDRANAIITEFLSLAKNKTVDLKCGNLNDILQLLRPLMESDALREGKNVSLEMGDVDELLLDEKEIRQLILNLFRNAMEAMEPGKSTLLRTFAQGEGVVLEVRDQGRGIPQNIMDQLGTPFFTTKENGVGLGLSVCYSIAVRHKATIEVDTSESGTIFRVRFPKIKSKNSGKEETK